MKARPEFVTDGHLEYMDGLITVNGDDRISSMEVLPYLKEEYDTLTDKEASSVYIYWLSTISRDKVSDET